MLIFGGGGIASGIEQAWPGDVTKLERADCDVTMSGVVGEALRRHKPTEVVCVAGVSHPNGHADRMREEVLTNLYGSMLVATMTDAPTVLIGSVAGMYGKPGHVGYCATKAGVISVVQSLAMEGRDIWCVSPGRVDTPMRQRDYPGDTPGSRLHPTQIGSLIVDILKHRLYEPGTNIVIRKEGLDTVILHEHRGDGWRERLRVGSPVTI